MAASSAMKFLRILGIIKESNIEMFVLSAATGFALVSEGFLLLGMIGFFSPITICLVVTIFFIISAKEAKFFLETFISYFYHRKFSFTSYQFLIGTFFIFGAPVQ